VTGLDAALRSCAVADRSDLGRLTGTGPDLLGLLHRLSTGDVKDLQPGEGRATVLTNAKGRIVERLTVHHGGAEGVLLVAGPGAASRVLAHLAKFTFAEKTGLTDVTPGTFAFAVVGPDWAKAAARLELPELAPYGIAEASIAGVRVRVARTNGFDAEGTLLCGPSAGAAAVRSAMIDAVAPLGGAAIDAETLESWRILRGLPAAGHELTEDHNPLEAGLRGDVSFTKGCYVGQEVVARLNTYGKVSRVLVRLDLPPGSPVPAVGSTILRAGVAVGAVTSAIRPEGRPAPVALAYAKSRELEDIETTVDIDDGGVLRRATAVRL
jgi:tRNA-modifying protein YgfZ